MALAVAETQDIYPTVSYLQPSPALYASTATASSRQGSAVKRQHSVSYEGPLYTTTTQPPTGVYAQSDSGTQLEGRVLRERIVDRQVKVPKKVLREDVIERIIVVPETIMREEIVEELRTVTETIIEVAKVVQQERIVEIPEVEYRDKIVEVVEKVIKEKIIEVPRIEYRERIIEVPKPVTHETFVEIPNIEYREVIVEKVVEVPEIRERVTVREVPVPQYVPKPPEEAVTHHVDWYIPIPVQATTTYEYQLARVQPRVTTLQYPLYVPRFVESPVRAEQVETERLRQMQELALRLTNTIGGPQAPGLGELDALASDLRAFADDAVSASVKDTQAIMTQKWRTGELRVTA